MGFVVAIGEGVAEVDTAPTAGLEFPTRADAFVARVVPESAAHDNPPTICCMNRGSCTNRVSGQPDKRGSYNLPAMIRSSARERYRNFVPQSHYYLRLHRVSGTMLFFVLVNSNGRDCEHTKRMWRALPGTL